MQVLVINSGSSSVKYELFEMEPERSAPGAGDGSPVWSAGVAEGEVEVGGQDGAESIDAAFLSILSELSDCDTPMDRGALAAVGHRVVHGGERFTQPVIIDDTVIEAIRELALLAPLHITANLAGVEAARSHLPDVPHVAVFDTTFHRTMPPHACAYGLPREVARANGIRRYGFHGTSHAYVSRRAAQLLGRPLESLDLITLHLGNGASVAAIRGGESVDTSMGMTPLEGLVMGTRCGDLDPAIPMLLGELTGRSREDVHRLLNHESGLAGLCGANDMRDVHRLADGGDDDARLALEVFCYRAKKYVGAYLAVLGRADALVFTAGIGENDPDVRARICAGLERLGIDIDEDKNSALVGAEGVISSQGAEVTVLVIPTDEELEIARYALACARAEERS